MKTSDHITHRSHTSAYSWDEAMEIRAMLNRKYALIINGKLHSR